MTLSSRPPIPVLLGFAYLIGAGFGVALTRFSGGVAFVWVATALLLPYLSVHRRRDWPVAILVCSVASFVVTTAVGFGFAAAPFMVVANMGEALVATVLLRRWAPHGRYFDSTAGISAFVLAAGIIAPALSGLISANVAVVLIGKPFWANWLAWFTGHGLGAVIWTPIVMLAIQGEARSWLQHASWRLKGEAVGLFALVAVAALLVFGQDTLPLLFLPLLPMMVVTIRLGRFGAAGSIVLLASIGCALTISGHGPINLLHVSTAARIEFLQFYLAIAGMLVLPIAALLHERKALFQRLSESEARYRLIADSAGDAIMNVAVDGTILYASAGMRSLVGFAPAKLIGRNTHDMIDATELAKHDAARDEAIANPHRTVSRSFRINTAIGGERWFETSLRATLDEDGTVTGLVSVLRDVSERKADEERLTREASTDPLTGLANRRAVIKRLERGIARVAAGEGTCAVAVFDLDRFKSVNDTHGHATGDRVLQAFAASATGAVRDADLVGRIGGEEFALILWNADEALAMKICERLRGSLAAVRVTAPDGTQIAVRASAGIAMVEPNADATSILAAADTALYQAKAGGRDRLVLAA
ncbi:MAG TPA: diguanylate cyclase [Sphingomonas sp.]|jgi:diguanylate cyclase (GGDEF)-like protein/PAS domain S-box-containing protein|nr:diguanylate cyclase [Sphingomonas sp.]